jgi:CO/xanthine dehydrogenase Mo-binding subunit
VRARAVATNTPPHGAFRGLGAPQAIFAIERHMDQVARAVNLTPEEFRRRNLLHKGDLTATGQLVNENVNFDALLERAFRESDYHAKRERFAKENPGATVKRGIGFASFMHGAGFTGSGEVYLASVVDVEATAEGIVRVLAASTEIGQGTNTVFSQIAADALGIGYDRIEIARPDTSAVPNSGPTVASRTSMVVGNLVEKAALGIKQQLVDAGLLCDACTEDEFVRACKRFIETRGPLRSRTKYEAPPGLFWNDKKYTGDAYGTYTWAVYVAEVAVDTVTFEARVTDFVAVQEVGKVIHPLFAAGQIEGGVAQAIGMALYENVVYREGRMANGQMTNYIMPTAADIPPIRVFFEENPYPFGPHGAKGIGELPMDGPAAAIVNAIQEATGICVREIPATPEVLMEAMTEKAGALV